MYVVTGASGNTGSVVASELLAHGKQVRVIVRDEKKGEAWKQRGAEVAVGTVDDAKFLAQALDGAEGAYLMMPPPPGLPFREGQKRLLDGLAGGVSHSKLPHAVVLSSVGAQHGSGTGAIDALGHLEQALRPLPHRFVFLRAAYFMENWGQVLGAVIGAGILPCFLKDVATPTIATRDIGKFAAEALLHPAAHTEVRQIAGPKDYTPSEAAETFSKLLGKPVTLELIPDTAAAAAMQQAGLPEEMARVFAEMYHGITTGRVAWEEGIPVHRGHTTLEEVLGGLLKGGAKGH